VRSCWRRKREQSGTRLIRDLSQPFDFSRDDARLLIDEQITMQFQIEVHRGYQHPHCHFTVRMMEYQMNYITITIPLHSEMIVEFLHRLF
jgi:hypothetical protein